MCVFECLCECVCLFLNEGFKPRTKRGPDPFHVPNESRPGRNLGKWLINQDFGSCFDNAMFVASLHLHYKLHGKLFFHKSTRGRTLYILVTQNPER